MDENFISNSTTQLGDDSESGVGELSKDLRPQTKGSSTPSQDGLDSHVDISALSNVCSKVFHNWEWSSNASLCSKGCRIIIRWNKDVVDALIISQTSQAVHVKLIHKADKNIIFCTFIYASNDPKERRHLWRDLGFHKSVVCGVPWILLGDFNVALNMEDSLTGSSSMTSAMCDFKDCLKHIDVIDINCSGLQYTWNQKPKGKGGTLKKLDRVIGNIDFVDMFPGLFTKKVSDVACDNMLRLITSDEIKHAMFDIGDDKAPDDLFFFTRGEIDSAKLIMDALDEFKMVSGLVPSIPKSTAFFCNVANHVKASILNIMPFLEEELPVKYLFVPLISSRLLNRDCKILCKYVISSMHVYWASVLVIPMGIISDIQQLMRGFLWCNGEYKRGRAKVDWDDICLPKSEGGNLCGFTGFTLINFKDALFGIFNLKIRNGLSVSLWYDRWCSLSPLSRFLSPRDIAREGYTLQAYVTDLILNGTWNWPQAWLAKAPNIGNIGNIVAPILNINKHDCLKWRDDNGNIMQFCAWKVSVRALADLDGVSPLLQDIILVLQPMGNSRSPFQWDFVSLDFRFQSRKGFTLSYIMAVDNVMILQSCNGLHLRTGLGWPPNDYVYNPSTNLFKMLPPTSYSHDDSPFYRRAGLRMDYDPTKSLNYTVVLASCTCSDIDIQTYCSKTGNWRLCRDQFNFFSFDHFDNAIFWNDTFHWLQNEDRDFTIYEMWKVCFVWPVSYRVNTVDCMIPLLKGWSIRSTVWSIVLGEMEEDLFLVINLSRKVMEYNLISKTLHEIYDTGSNQLMMTTLMSSLRLLQLIITFMSSFCLLQVCDYLSL
ncbi:auxin efflux carrier [Tanacetum coccineum]